MGISKDITAALEMGATATRAGLYDANGELLAEAVGEPANPVEYGIRECAGTIAKTIGRLPQAPIDSLFAAVSGAARHSVREELLCRLEQLLPPIRVVVSGDIHPILYANLKGESGILAIAGTGSSILAYDNVKRAVGNPWRLIGGRGRVFGDDGSAYAIAVAALKAGAMAVDGMGPATRLVEALATAVNVLNFSELTHWSASAPKNEVAKLAQTVSEVAQQGDVVARKSISSQARLMALQVKAAARWLDRENAPVLMYGSVLDNEPLYRETFMECMREAHLNAKPAEVRGHRAVFEAYRMGIPLDDWGSERSISGRGRVVATEQRSRGPALDTLSPLDIVRRMANEDARISEAISAAEKPLAECVAVAAAALQNGGRIIYAGAGTSGRLGVLDASECPPTFGVSADRVVGVIAGGERALRESVEGAEDDAEAAQEEMATLEPPLNAADFVIGITASGTTPYVRAALRAAKSMNAKTALICCNDVPGAEADIVAVIETGPEVLAGSTRLKAGTATKMALNMISTGAFALSGLIYNGYMIGVRPVNAKLRKRAAGIISALCNCGEERATCLLDQSGGSVAAAVIMARKQLSFAEASRLLTEKASLRAALDGE